MKKMRWTRLRIFAVSATSLVLLLGVAAVVHPAGRWRVAFLAQKVTGGHPDTSWGDVVRRLMPGGGSRAAEDRPFLTRRNPLTSPADVEAGAELFRSQCAACHGLEGHGRSSDLTGGQFRHGGSDWAIFRNIADGVPGTAMEGYDLPEESIWRMVAFIRTLSGPPADSSAREAMARLLADMSPVTAERLVRAADEPDVWLTYSGDFYSRRHSGLQQIDRTNVGQLDLKWVFQMPTIHNLVETTPLVVDGVMFVTEPPHNVYALDAATGAELWRYEREIEGSLRLCCGRVNRGLAVLGDRLFLGTLDAHVVALDARTGNVLWDTEMAVPEEGYSGTAAPLAAGDRVIVGMAGGEFGTRGFVDAYDAETGERVWRFHTVPAPGEPGSETWAGDSWKTGGAATWLTGSYDPDLNLVYWATGNPAPDYQGDIRAGDNLYANSVVALDFDTGQLKWYFQFTPHDVHDWDSVQMPVLVDAEFDGRPRKLMLFANRNAFFYVLDRETGEFLRATPFAKQNWAEGIGPDGRPIPIPGMAPSEEGTLTYPGDGATNWWSPSYNPRTGLLHVAKTDLGSIFFRGRRIEETVPGVLMMGSTSRLLGPEQGQSSIIALVPQTGEAAWEYMFDGVSIGMAGTLSTAGDVVFTADGARGTFIALDATSGRELWRRKLGGNVKAAPVTYSVNGRQLVSIAAGRAIFTFGLR